MVGILGPTLEDLWQQRLVAEAGRVLLDHERYALILDAGADPERQRMLAGRLRDQYVDGLIVSPIDPADPFWADSPPLCRSSRSAIHSPVRLPSAKCCSITARASATRSSTSASLGTRASPSEPARVADNRSSR